MKKALIALTALMLGSAVWAANATPLTGSIPTPSQNNSPMETVGCTTAGDNCPYGYRIERHGGKGWSCERCGDQKQGSRYRDWNDRYNEPRRYQDYGNYEPRRYRDYDERYYQPRYNREY
jgi:hypothetical protein